MNSKTFKKLFFVLAAIAMLTIFVTAFVACNNDNQSQNISEMLVVFDHNDGTDTTVAQVIDPRNFEYTPQREGYTFDRWTLDKEGTQSLSLDVMQNGMILYAQWNIKSYSVKFFDDQFNLISSQRVNHGSGAIAPTEDEIAPFVPQGKVFGGWDKEFDNVKQNLEVYLVLVEAQLTFNVSFVDNGTTLSSFENGQAGQAIPQPTYPQDRDGLHFEGYMTQDGKFYHENDLFVANEIYYSQWSIQVPTAPSIISSNVVYGNDVEFSLDNVVTFDNLTYSYEWYDAQNNLIGQGTTFTISAPVVATYEVYVKVIASCQGFESKYALSQSKSVQVEKAVLTATMQSATITYGDDAPATYAVSFDGFVLSDDESVVDLSNVAFSVNYTAGADVGVYAVSATGFDASNYTIVGTGENNAILSTLTVNKKDLHVSKAYSTVYTGTTASGLFFSNVQEDALTVEGLLDGHVLSLSLESAGANVGEYTYGNNATAVVAIVDSEDVAKYDNYNVSLEASVQITPATIRFTNPTNATFAFDNTAHFASVLCATAGCTVKYGTDGETYDQDTLSSFVNAGTYTVYAKLTRANYFDAYTSYDIVINKAQLNITALGQDTVYGEPFTLNQSQYQLGEGQSTFGINLNVRLATNYVVGNPVGDTYQIDVEYDANDNFDVVATPSTLTVAKATLNATIANASVVYGEDFLPTTALVSLEGLYGTDNAMLSMSTTYDKATANVGTDEYISCTSANTNYNLVVATQGTLTVLQRAISLQIGNASVVYGNAFDNSALSYTTTSGSLFAQDALQVEYVHEYTIGTNANQSLDVDAIVKVLNNGVDVSANYDITLEKGALSVERRDVTIKADDVQAVYGDALNLASLTYSLVSGSFYGNAPSASFSTEYKAGSITQNQKVSVSMVDNNYNVTCQDGVVTIIARDALISLDKVVAQNGTVAVASIDDATIDGVYGNDTFAGQFATSTTQNGVYTSSENELGENLVWIDTLTILNKDGVNVKDFYNITYALSVEIKTISIAFEKTNYTGVYDGKPHSGNVRVEGNATITYSVDNVTFAQDKPSFTNVGEYTVYFVLHAEGMTDTDGSYTVKITKRSATITVQPQDAIYGDSFATSSEMAVVNGVLNADLASLAITLNCDYAQGNDAGEYAITATYVANANYDVTVVNSTLTVGQKALFVTVANASVIYGNDYTPSLSLVSVDGLYGDDDALLSVSTQYVAGDNVGSYAILATSANTNYTATITNGVLSVSPRTITLCAEDKNVTYGDAIPSLTYTTSNTYNNYVVENVVIETNYAQGSAVGTYNVTLTVGDTNANYNFETTNSTLTVAKRNVTVKANDITVVYGEAVESAQYGYTVVSGTFYGNAPKATYSTTYTVGDTSEKSVSVAMTDANYNITVENGVVSIAKRTATISHSMIIAQNNVVASFDMSEAHIQNAYDNDVFVGTLATVSTENGTYVAHGANLGDFEWTSALVITNENDEDVTALYVINYELSATISEDFIGHTTTSYNKPYDGLAHSGAVHVTEVSEYSIEYSLNGVDYSATLPQFINVCSVTVYYVITAQDKTPTYGEFSVTITKKSATISVNAQSITYGDAFTANASMATVNGVVSADLASLAIALNCEYTQGDNAGEYDLTATYTANANYNITVVNSTLTVAKKALTITVDNASVVYGNAFAPTTALASVEGLYGDDDAMLSMSTTYVVGNTVGTYAIVATSANTNYAATITNGVLSVTARPITITVGNASVVYGNAFDKSQVEAQLTSGTLYAQDTYTCAFASTYTVGDNANQTLAITAVATLMRGSTDVTSSYDVTYVEGALTIGKRTITVTAQSASTTYGDVAPTYTYSTSNGYNGYEVQNVSISSTYAQGSVVGTYPITVSVADTNENYNFVTVNGTLTVGKRAVSVSYNGTMAYNNGRYATVDLASLTFIGAYAGDTLTGVLIANSDQEDTYSTDGTSLGDFNGTVSVKNASDADVSACYTITYNVSVLVKPINVTFSATGYTGAYDTNAHTGNVVVNDASAVNATVLYKVNGEWTATAPTFVNASNYTVEFKICADNRTDTTGTFAVAISKKSASITAQDVTLTYGDAFVQSASMYSVSGVYAQDLAGLNVTLTATGYSAGSDVKSYNITVAYTANGNYTISTTGATLTVVQKVVTITASDVNTTYGTLASMPSFSVDVDGVKSAISLYADGYAVSSNVGNYQIKALCSNNNYSVQFASTYYVKVAKRTVTITADNKTITIGDAVPSLTYTTSNAYGGYTVQGVSVSTAYAQGDAVGTYAITLSVADTNANYNFVTVNGTLTVNKANLYVTIQLSSNTITYGDTLPTITVVYPDGFNSSLVSGTAQPVFTKGGNVCTGTLDVGAYGVGITGLTSNSYNIIASTGTTLTVNAKAIDVTVGNITATYSQNADMSNVEIISVTDMGARPYLSFATNYKAGDNVGTYAISATSTSNNYTVRSVTGSVIVDALAVNITVGNATTTYGEAADLSGVSISSNVAGAVNFITPTTTYVAGNNAGNYAIGATVLSGCNYKVGTVTNGVLTVNPALATITGLTTQEVNYVAGQTFTFSTSSLVAKNSNAETLTGSFTAFTSRTTAGTFGQNITFTSNDGNYSGTCKCYLKVKSVDVNGTLYTIEDALNVATSGKTIKLTVSTAFADADNSCYGTNNAYYTVKSDVTMLLPYSASDTKGWIGAGEEGSTNYDSHPASNGTATLYINLTVPSNVNFIVTGTLVVGALTGSKASGTNQNCISGGYSQITLNGTLTLNSATLRVMGYIKGNGRITSNNSTVIENMVLTGWPGGSEGVARYVGSVSAVSYITSAGNINVSNPKMFPFSFYDFRAIQVENTLNYGSTLQAYTKIATSKMEKKVLITITVNAQINEAYMTIVSSSATASAGIIRMSSGAKVVKSFVNNRVKLDLYGTFADGYTSLTIAVMKKTANLETGTVVFPINGLTDITLKSGATFTQTYSYKLMPGATFTVEQGATYTINSGAKMVVYTADWTDPCGAAKYPSAARGNAILTINGTMNINGNFGGVIYSSGTGKVVFGTGCTITGVTSCEGQGSFAGTSFSFTETDVTKDASLNGYSGSISKGTTYTYNGSTWA